MLLLTYWRWHAAMWRYVGPGAAAAVVVVAVAIVAISLIIWLCLLLLLLLRRRCLAVGAIVGAIGGLALMW